MPGKKLAGRGIRRHVLAPILLGALLVTAAFLTAMRSDMDAAQRTLLTTAGYVREQCDRYARIELATETKSLMRVIESSRQVVHHLREQSGTEAGIDLERCARDVYVSGILLLDEQGNITAQYHESGELPEPLREELTSSVLLDTAVYPEKSYAVRLHDEDGSELDLAAVGREDAPGVVAAYYRTPAEYLNSFNLSIASLLSGYETENGATIVVSQGDTIVASNDESLIGAATGDIGILRRIQADGVIGKLVHTNQVEGEPAQYFGLMERGRDVYVYCFLPEANILRSTLLAAASTLLIYAVLVAAVYMIRLQLAQRYREEQVRAQQQYAESLRDKNEQLSRAVEQADRANAAKTSFLSRMTHDIRTPLNGIIGLLEIDAAHPEDTALVNANREKMRVAANHLLALINDILQMSKLESGEVTLAHELVDLDRLTADILTIVGDKAAESGVTLEYDKSSYSISTPWVYGSPVHLRQIFLNIYTNCIKYNRVGGKVTSRVENLGIKDFTVTYRWTITDTGIGMSRKFLQHIFDPFAQERSDDRSIRQGTGLGMTIVKGLVEKMNGTIEIESREGEGSTFIITLPFEIAEAPAQIPEQNAQPEESIAGLHLLLAEDNALNAEIAKTLLEDAGAQVTVVTDGKQAVETLEGSEPGTFDGVLMDMMMPVMDGITATHAIRALPRSDLATIPILAMTANAFAEDAQRCLDAGMNAHLSKPLELQKVIHTIARFCRRT